MKKILVPTDFSECADNAVAVAKLLALKSSAQLIFQHLCESSESVSHTLKAESKFSKHRAKESDELVAEAKLYALVKETCALGIDAQPLLVFNKGSETIESYIKPLGIDLVVMGSHGATGIRELLIGSHTQRVVRHTDSPVLVVKHRPKKGEFNSILLASTFHENLTDMIEPVIDIAKLSSCTIHLLYVGLEDDPQSKNMIEKKMNELTQLYPQQNFTNNFITTNDPEWGIKHITKEINPDLISLSTHLQTGSFIFSHSLAEALVNHESRPVLVINQ